MLGANKLLAWVGHLLGIDSAVFFAIAAKMWSMAAGLLTTLLIASFFTPELQGYYYTFFSVLSLQVFAELGLGTVITSYASHEWAKLAFDKDGRAVGDRDALSRLTSLGNFALRWYLAAGITATVALIVSGFVFFGITGWKDVSAWGGPWILLCLVSGANLCCMPIWALLEGCSQVSHVYRYRLVQSVASSTAGWVGVYLGAGLWVCAIMGAATLIVTGLTAIRRYRPFLQLIMFDRPKGPKLNWRTDILPMQWRISLSWISGYFIYSLFTPVVFHFHGPVVAGQMGMTWMFVAALTAVASAWVAPNAPAFGVLIAQRKYEVLDMKLWRLTRIVAVLTTVAALVIWVGIYTLSVLDLPLGRRLLSPLATACLLAAAVIQAISLPTSTYLRAHRKEPLLVLSVVTALLTAVVVVVTGRFFSVEGVAIGYLAVVALVTPFVWPIWRRCIREWH
jgi:O-antigen/teichoic acid export membrane protein